MADTQTPAPADFIEQARHYRTQGGERSQLITYLQQCGCDDAAASQWADRFDFDLGMTGASLPADTSPHIVELVIAHRAAANPAPAPIVSPPAVESAAVRPVATPPTYEPAPATTADTPTTVAAPPTYEPAPATTADTPTTVAAPPTYEPAAATTTDTPTPVAAPPTPADVVPTVGAPPSAPAATTPLATTATDEPVPTLVSAPLPPAAAARAEGMKARIAAKHADPVVEKKKDETPTFEETTEFGYAIASTEEADPNEAIHGAHGMARAGKYREDIVEHLIASGVTPDEADYVAAMTGARRRPVVDAGAKKKRGRKRGRNDNQSSRARAGASIPIGAIVLAFVCIAGGLALAYFSYDAWQEGTERIGRRSPLGGLIAAGALVLYGMRTMIGQRTAA